MWVSYFFEDGDFPIYAIYVRLVLDLVFLQDLDSDLIARDPMRPLLYFSKCAFSFGLADDETSDVLPLGILLLLVLLLLIALLSGLFHQLASLFLTSSVVLRYFDVLLAVDIIDELLYVLLFLLWRLLALFLTTFGGYSLIHLPRLGFMGICCLGFFPVFSLIV